MTAPETAVRVRRNERDCVHAGPRDRLERDGDRGGHEAPQGSLLPRSDDRTDSVVVMDGGTRAGKREPPSGALAAAPHRPGRRRAAPVAEGWLDPRQPSEALLADLKAAQPTGDAPLRQEDVEHSPKLRGASLRVQH